MFCDPFPDSPEPVPRGPGLRRRLWRATKITAVAVLVVAVTAVGWVFRTTEDLASQVHRQSGVFAGLNEALRPPATGALTFLMVAAGLSAEPGSKATGHNDVVMVVRLNARRNGATVVSLPGTSWVPIPGHGMGEIDTSYVVGGASLLVRTVEAQTHIRVDHFTVIDFGGFQRLVDSVGGVDIAVPRPGSRRILRRHLDGAAALAFVRQGNGLPSSDGARLQRSLLVLRALLTRAFSGAAGNPVRGLSFIDLLSKWATVDDTLTDRDLMALSLSLRDLRPRHFSFLIVPVARVGQEGSSSVVFLDAALSTELWHAVNTDTVRAYLKKHPASALGDSTP